LVEDRFGLRQYPCHLCSNSLKLRQLRLRRRSRRMNFG
jgi:hypothetical protein